MTCGRPAIWRALPVGRDVVVIGGGMTAVDAAVQSKLLGAENVSIVYRRSQPEMPASRHEQDHATASGVKIIANAAPVAVHGMGSVREVEFGYTRAGAKGLEITSQTFRLKADQLFTAIGQTISGAPATLALAGARSRSPAQGAPACPTSGRGAIVPRVAMI